MRETIFLSPEIPHSRFPRRLRMAAFTTYNVFLPPTSQPQPCTMFFYTGIAITNVSRRSRRLPTQRLGLGLVVPLQHDTRRTITPRLPRRSSPESCLSRRISALLAAETLLHPGPTSQGRKWLFGGNGFPYPSPLGNQLPVFLNDLWVFDPSVWRLGSCQSSHFYEQPEHSHRLSGARRPAGSGGCSHGRRRSRLEVGQLQLDGPSNRRPLPVWRPGNRQQRD